MEKNTGEQGSTLIYLGQEEQPFFFPEGLLGFTSTRQFVLNRIQSQEGAESPFFFLRAKEENISFPLISPHFFKLGYQVSPSPDVITKLEAGSVADLVVMVIVTLRDRMEDITANLQGPLLLNPVSQMGIQVVMEEYPVRYPFLNKPPP